MTLPNYTKPLPEITPHMAPYWHGLQMHTLLLQMCVSCTRFRFPAASICPHCLSSESHWQQVSGDWVLSSYATFHKAYWPSFSGSIPYSVIQVQLDVGVKLYSNWYADQPKEPLIGMSVVAQYEHVSDAVTLLKFSPREQSK